MIRDKLIPMLQQRYTDKGVQINLSGNPIAVFPAKHPAVGGIEIYDDGDEATVYIGDITHTHFNPYNHELTQDEIDQEVSEEVIGFLEDIFADQILFWKSKHSGSGGWQHIDLRETSIGLDEEAEYFLWSGPYER